MFDQKRIFEKGLVQIIRNLKESGIEDITTEEVGLHNGNKSMRFRFYLEDQWLSDPQNKANEATILFGKSYKGCIYPDHIVKYDGEVYFVVIV